MVVTVLKRKVLTHWSSYVIWGDRWWKCFCLQNNWYNFSPPHPPPRPHPTHTHNLFCLHSLVCWIHNKLMSQLVAYISTISVWAVLCDEGGGWQLGRCSASIDKQMSILSTALTKVSNTKTLLQITPHARCFFCVCMCVSMHACMHLMYICRCVRACVWFWFCLLQCNSLSELI